MDGTPAPGPMDPKKPPRLPALLAGLGLALGTVLALGAVGELALRVAGWRPPVLVDPAVRGTYRFGPGERFTYVGFRPGSPVEFRNPVTLNRHGFHDLDYDEERPTPETFRVLVLGDSYVAAMEVGVRASFHKLLEERLRAEDPLGRGSYEVIAFGQGNRAQKAQLAWLRELGPRYRADLVLLVCFTGNDIMENSETTFERARRFALLYQRVVSPRKLAFYDRVFAWKWSRLNGFVADRMTTFYAAHLDWFDPEVTRGELSGPDAEVYRVPPGPEWLDAWRETATLLDEVRAEAGRQGARFALAVISGPQSIAEVSQETLRAASGAGLDPLQPERWVLEWCRERGVPCLSLGERFRAADPGRVFWRYDAHLTPHGHRVAADALYPFVVREAGERQGD